MVTLARWREAQATEPDFYAGMVSEVAATLDILYHNSQKAHKLSHLLKEMPESCVEVGLGPFGLGLVGFLPEIKFRVGVDPAPPVVLDPLNRLHGIIQDWRRPVRYIVATGENLPLPSACADLVVCCNVVDHAFEPVRILRELNRILRPGGLLFFDVDTFSILGLLKWHLWTKHRHKDELLVRAHTYRMFEPVVRRRLLRFRYEVLYSSGHNPLTLLFGHYRISTLLLRKPKRA